MARPALHQSKPLAAVPGGQASGIVGAVRLYPSSFRLGNHPEYLVRLAGEAALWPVVANAMDDQPPEVRRQAVERELLALCSLQLCPAELDLRRYAGEPAALTARLAGYGALWVRGGNVFVLRHALHRSGGDTVVTGALARDTLAYAGYSAGPCVLAPSLRGLEAVDDAGAVPRIYGASPIFDGLGVLDYAIVPHYRSPDHPESAACDQARSWVPRPGATWSCRARNRVAVLPRTRRIASTGQGQNLHHLTRPANTFHDRARSTWQSGQSARHPAFSRRPPKSGHQWPVAQLSASSAPHRTRSLLVSQPGSFACRTAHQAAPPAPAVGTGRASRSMSARSTLIKRGPTR